MIVAAANTAIDRLLEVERLELGTIHQPQGALEVAGGKALNVARSAHALGSDVLAVALLGGYHGMRVAALLEADGVPYVKIATGGETRITLAVLARDNGELTQFYEEPDPRAGEGFASFRDAVLERCASGDWMVMSGRMPPGCDPAAAGELVRDATVRGSPVAVDQHGPWLAASVAAGPALVKVNAQEACEVTGQRPRDAIRELRARAGGARVVVTMGTEGALLADGDQLWHGRLAARGDYSTGCGDAFLGGMVGALERDPDAVLDAFAAGVGAATANAELPGPGILSRTRAEELARDVKLTVL